MVKRASPSLISFVTFVFFLSAALSGRSIVVSGSVISANTASSTNFELQTNLVTCGTEEGAPAAPPSEDSATANSAAAAVAKMSVAVCSPPESKLFGNVQIVNGTPHPGPTGVRGRLYDVGTLCDAKVSEKIDRAWVAFLDCSGCSLATKLANLESSNPQAILIYNQTSCVFPAPQAPAPVPAPSPSPTPSPAPSPAPAPEPRPPATSSIESAPAAPVETEPVEKTPAPPPKSGEGNGDNGDQGSGDGDDDGDNDDDEDSTKHPKHSNRRRSLEAQESDGYVHSPRTQPRPHPISELEYPRGVVDDARYVHSPRPRPRPHPIVSRRSFLKTNAESVNGATAIGSSRAADLSQATIKFGTTVAMVESLAVDYLFKILLGPASYAPIPTALRALKTIAQQNDPNTNPSLGTKGSSSSNSITDLMVSISPSNNGESSSSEPKFLSMSKPIFGAVIGVIAAVVCAAVLGWVVRPMYLRRRQKNEDRIEELEQSNNHGGNEDGGYFAAGDVGAVDREPKLDPEQFYDNQQQQQLSHQYQQATSSGFCEVPVMPTLVSARPHGAKNDIFTPVETEKLHFQDENDNNTAPETDSMSIVQARTNVPMSNATADHDISNDDAKLAQQQLRRLRQQQASVETTEPDPRRASLSSDGSESVMPAWRRHRDGQRSVSSISVTSTQATSTPVTRLPLSQAEDQRSFEMNEWEEEPSPVSRVSIDSGRRGGDLFNAPSLRRNRFQS
ncbi:hypothetical protein EMPS_07221 [Entomortierella parvispora]|uniref:Uncharacterized protein n=1 Tax=Entomortierella parvispora TaxID=205924 RepID=A0A9P3HE61_9FUNG|nr:hypothetical protein EMPS_07221 [Entomortierella parvispora]